MSLARTSIKKSELSKLQARSTMLEEILNKVQSAADNDSKMVTVKALGVDVTIEVRATKDWNK